MEKEELRSLYEQGYRFAYDDCDFDEIERYELVELDDAWLRKLLDGEEHLSFCNDEGDTRLYRLTKPCQILVSDVISLLARLLDAPLNVETVRGAFSVFDSAIDGKKCFVPDAEVDNTMGADPFFNDSNHLVKFAIVFALNHQERRLEKDLDDLGVFLAEISKTNGYHPESNSYSKGTLSLLLWNLAQFVSKDGNLPEELAEFYSENLVRLAQEGDYRSVRMAGYEFYEGTNSFEANPHRALELLTKAYEMEEDPEIARTLGYIYYYGRTAFRLVSGIYGETLSHYLSGEDFTKFADVALRLGSYYRDGVFVKKNLQEAYAYYLEARAAIRSRLAAGEYIGDRGVAAGIASAIVGLESQLGRKTERQIILSILVPECLSIF